MLQQPIRKTFDIGGGRMVTIETGRLARQADGAVTVSIGNCMLLATVVANKDPKEGQDFFPLSVDYQEKFAAAGRIPGSFFKREARQRRNTNSQKLKAPHQAEFWSRIIF